MSHELLHFLCFNFALDGDLLHTLKVVDRVDATADVKLPSGFAVYAMRFGDLHSAAEEITQYAADVVVLEPAELRDFVVRGLTAVAESVSAT